MTVRGGIADILEAVDTTHAARLQRRLASRAASRSHPESLQDRTHALEAVGSAQYIEEMRARSTDDFKKNVRQDLDRRRDFYCPKREAAEDRVSIVHRSSSISSKAFRDIGLLKQKP